MVDISTKTNERTGIGTVEDSDEIIWLNKKHTDEGLDHQDWQSKYRKGRYKLVDEPKKQSNRTFL